MSRILRPIMSSISIHSLRVEGDSVWYNAGRAASISIHSLRVEGDGGQMQLDKFYKSFQSTPSVWRETLAQGLPVALIPISIHSLRVEGDDRQRKTYRKAGISIHSLRVEGDHNNKMYMRSWDDFNPLPPCGGRLPAFPAQVHPMHFNSLPPCGGRHFTPDLIITNKVFQSTPSVWRETRRLYPKSGDF